ncbi:hypothetical protein PM082_014422 [Marasmius tenuissimus]|nr:hypothetical protein PM082_014422 [Marasmius tenuissimus]
MRPRSRLFVSENLIFIKPPHVLPPTLRPKPPPSCMSQILFKPLLTRYQPIMPTRRNSKTKNKTTVDLSENEHTNTTTNNANTASNVNSVNASATTNQQPTSATNERPRNIRARSAPVSLNTDERNPRATGTANTRAPVLDPIPDGVAASMHNPANLHNNNAGATPTRDRAGRASMPGGFEATLAGTPATPSPSDRRSYAAAVTTPTLSATLLSAFPEAGATSDEAPPPPIQSLAGRIPSRSVSPNPTEVSFEEEEEIMLDLQRGLQTPTSNQATSKGKEQADKDKEKSPQEEDHIPPPPSAFPEDPQDDNDNDAMDLRTLIEDDDGLMDLIGRDLPRAAFNRRGLAIIRAFQESRNARDNAHSNSLQTPGAGSSAAAELPTRYPEEKRQRTEDANDNPIPNSPSRP